MYTSLFGINQAQIQRYTALPTMTHVRKYIEIIPSILTKS